MTLFFDAAACRNFENSVNLEWLCTNGLGGYASGSVAGANTRKYHGYLVVAVHPPVDRFVTLSRVEDRVLIGGADETVKGRGTKGMVVGGDPAAGLAAGLVAYDLSTDEFPDTVHPQGYQNLISFEQKWGPVWRFQLGDAVVEKSITLVHGQDTVIVRYELISYKGEGAVRLQIHPMMAGRDFHGTIQSNYRPAWQGASDPDDASVLHMSAPECPVKLVLSHNADRFTPNGSWWYNFIFRQERMRGYPDHDDLWTPGMLEFTLKVGKPVGFICSTKAVAFGKAGGLIQAEDHRWQHLRTGFAKSNPDDEFLAQLSVAADQFLVRRGAAGAAGANQMSVIAGYPWFEDWGRDTFISLPGLTLVTGRFEAARSILATFADHLRRGLLPNRFPDKAVVPEYHTVDAAMWFVQAAYEYWRYSGDGKFLGTYLYRPLCQIMDSYRDGTDFGIRMEGDGLIRAGEGNVQLTWMDAKVGDWVVTPRHGKPVEINALWYSNLRIMALVAKQAGDAGRAGEFGVLADKVGAAFAGAFWNAEKGCLFDVIDDSGRGDAAIRPNQLMAVSLPFSALDKRQQMGVVNVAEKMLVTPMGMRTLAPGSLGYHGRCAGDQLARDMAYHQGTAWPWLIGPFVSAYVKVHGETAEARKGAWKFLEPFKEHLKTAGLGSISEIADGDPKFTARGCVAQAWSVAEVLRAYYEDVLHQAPAWPHAKEGKMATAGA